MIGNKEKFKKKCLEDKNWVETKINNSQSKTLNDEGEIYIYVKPSKKTNFNKIKIKTKLKLKAEKIYEMLHDHEYRKEWDSNMIDGKVIENPTENTEIGYYSIKIFFGIKNRDFCTIREWYNDEKEYIIFNRSVEHKECPSNKNFVRAISYLTGYYMKKINDSECEFIFYSHSDPKGWLPSNLINWIMEKIIPNSIKKIKEACEKYDEWKKQ